MKDVFTLDEAALFLGVPVETIRTKTKRGELPYSTALKGKRQIKVIDKAVLLACGGVKPDDYEKLFGQYCQELKAGIISAKPVSDKYLDRVQRGAKRYWATLQQKPSIEGINASNFRLFLSKIKIDDDSRRDYHATKEVVRSSLIGFMRLLVREGLKTPQQQQELIDLKLRRKYKDRIEYPDDKAVLEFITRNQAWTIGRTALDRQIMDLLLHLYSYAGIRKMEAAMLRLEDIDLSRPSIRLWGKGGKRRVVPIVAELEKVIANWLTLHRPESGRPELILNNEGLPLTESAISDRFTRFSKHVKKRVHPHGLRHACATILANKGMPTVLIKEMLGHTNISTTNIYLNTTEADLFAYFAPVEKPEPKRVETAATRHYTE